MTIEDFTAAEKRKRNIEFLPHMERYYSALCDIINTDSQKRQKLYCPAGKSTDIHNEMIAVRKWIHAVKNNINEAQQ